MDDTIKEKLLVLYKLIKMTFEKKSIIYCSSGGTTLGTIRHKGFIPHDDDIDLLVFYISREELHEVLKPLNDLGFLVNYIENHNMIKVSYPFNKKKFKYPWGYPAVDIFLTDKKNDKFVLQSFAEYVFVSDLEKIIKFPFEDTYVPVPFNYRNVLLIQYGNDCMYKIKTASWDHKLEIAAKSKDVKLNYVVYPCFQIKKYYVLTEKEKLNNDIERFDIFPCLNEFKIFEWIDEYKTKIDNMALHNLTTKQIAKTLSHLKIFEEIVANKYDCALITSDNAIIGSDFDDRINSVLQYAPLDVYIIMLSHNCLDQEATYNEELQLATGHLENSDHYIISYEGAKYILDNCYPIKQTIEMLFSEVIVPTNKMYLSVKSLIDTPVSC